MFIRSAAFIAASLLLSQAVIADCSHTAARNAKIDANGVRAVVIHAGAGDLTVRGIASVSGIEARGEACAGSQERLDAIRIEVRRDGDTVHVATVIPEHESFMNFGKIDLTVELPARLDIDLKDSSGDLSLTGVASARIEDSSGDQSIRDIAGNVVVQDSSGEIDIKSIRGNVEVSDSSGDVRIVEVTGDVRIPVDSSGGLVMRSIHGQVHIETDSSGDISISDVNRDVTIDTDSSGDIRVEDVGGQLTVAHDSSGDIDHRNVLGAVSIPRSKR